MSERKVINKYYPPDFDPSKLPKGERPKNGQVTVRMMMPMSVRCLVCGEFIYKGKKFNSKKETVLDEEYCGVKVFRLYMKCPNCNSEFTIKTDPKNSDYIAEHGCSRNFEPWREKEAIVEEVKKKREEEEEGDAMKALENRTMDSKVEMDIIDALEEIKTLNARNSKITPDKLIEEYNKKFICQEEDLTENEIEELENVIFKGSANYVKRIAEENKDEPDPKRQKLDSQPEPSFKIFNTKPSSSSSPANSKPSIKPPLKPKIKIVPKKTNENEKK